MSKYARSYPNLSVMPLRHLCAEPKRGNTSAYCRRSMRIWIAPFVIGTVMLDPIGGSWQSSRAADGAISASISSPDADLPRFITGSQLAPLQDALLAYNLNTTLVSSPTLVRQGVSIAQDETSMQIAVAGAAKPAASETRLSAMEFHAALLEARRDAGEARALADEMHRQASAITDHFGAKEKGEVQIADKQFTPPVPDDVSEFMKTGTMHSQATRPQRKATKHAAAETVPVDLAGAFKPFLDFARKAVAGVSLAPASHGEDAREPLPGRMALGLGRPPQLEAGTGTRPADIQLKTDTRSQPDAQPQPDNVAPVESFEEPSDGPGPTNAGPSGNIQSARLEPEAEPETNASGDNDLAPAHSIARVAAKLRAGEDKTRSPLQLENVSPEAAAAYGFVPLAPPKDRARPGETDITSKAETSPEAPAREVIKRPAAHVTHKPKAPVAILKIPSKREPSSAGTSNGSTFSFVPKALYSWMGGQGANNNGN